MALYRDEHRGIRGRVMEALREKMASPLAPERKERLLRTIEELKAEIAALP